MTKTRLLGLLAFGGMALVISCDNGSSDTAASLAANDCPVGTFRPVGLTDCVFPATDISGQAFGVSDNRCATDQAAIPSQCISETGDGLRSYLSTSTKCAPGYRFLPGACNRSGLLGTAGCAGDFCFPTGTAGTIGGTAGTFGATAGTGGFAGTTGVAGESGTAGTGFAGDAATGVAGSNLTGTAGATAGANGGAGTSGTAGLSDAGGAD